MLPHSYGPTCRLTVPRPDPDQRHSSKPPRLNSHFFYTSAFALDDPLSTVPPPSTGQTSKSKRPPRPFSIYDNAALEEAWAGLWKSDGRKKLRKRLDSAAEASPSGSFRAGNDPENGRPRTIPNKTQTRPPDASGSHDNSPKSTTPTFGSSPHSSDITGMPFLRAPSRNKLSKSPLGDPERESRPKSRGLGRAHQIDYLLRSDSEAPPELEPTFVDDFVQVPVGVSRLHLVNMPSLQIKPIYWSPLHDDIATAWRGTWFYKNSMLPIESDVANQLEKGYLDLAPWSETWEDELNSAVEAGADGETRAVHMIWPKEELSTKSAAPTNSRPSTSSELNIEEVKPKLPPQYDDELNTSISVSAEGLVKTAKPDAKPDGTKRFPNSAVFYANANEAYVLRPNQLPSTYYNRRPIMSARKGKPVGIPIVRGFDWRTWEKIHPTKVTAYTLKAQEGAALSQSGTAQSGKRDFCEACSSEESRQLATDLILVIHGIGQKLSERVESFHFTHAMNGFRREMNVELVSDPVKKHLRPDFGGVMVLPVNWRSTLSFEDGGHRGTEDIQEATDSTNSYSLKDITPETIPSVRNLVNEVMSDIPYYLSHHKPKMIQAVVTEANRIYRLWCKNNPGFQANGKVHLIAHSLGSAMAIDILSNQPTTIPPSIDFESSPIDKTFFEFDTKSIFFCGSPAGFFLLLNRGSLIPRKDREKPGSHGEDRSPGVAGEAGTYGCLAIDNLYNILSVNDPIAYQLNPIVDAEYAAGLKPASIPLSTKGLFGSLSGIFSTPPPMFGPPPRLPLTSLSNPSDPSQDTSTSRLGATVEMDTHDFTREQLAEKKFALLNDNLQIDYFLASGGGPLEIQYLSMLSAHSSYWISRDFIRFVVIEIGRPRGREYALGPLRAAKKIKK